jgi:hypothetical protein
MLSGAFAPRAFFDLFLSVQSVVNKNAATLTPRPPALS